METNALLLIILITFFVAIAFLVNKFIDRELHNT
jgi:flagellar biogenesis protein FliO